MGSAMTPKMMHWIEQQPWLSRWVGPSKQLVYAFDLALEKRLWFFLFVDAVLVLRGVLDALVVGGEMDKIYTSSVFLPAMLLALPALSGIVALERRVGSLDLALSTASTERYFLRRVVAICSLFWVQGSVILLLSYLETGGSGPGSLARAFFQCLLFHLFIGANALFWATRLRTTGGVWGGSLFTTLVFRSWLVTSPLQPSWLSSSDLFFGLSRPLLAWIWAMAVVALATLILYLYARERLIRPETMLD